MPPPKKRQWLKWNATAARDGAGAMRFPPWIGKYYGKSGNALGVKLLILGEMHYDHEHDGNADWGTEDIVRNHLSGVERFSYFTKISSLFPPVADGIISVDDFWHHAALYNYIQQFATTPPGVPPSSEMYRKGTPHFHAAMQRLRPDACLVIGPRVWKNMDQSNIRHDPCAEHDEHRYYEYDDGTRAVIAYVHHPASFGWSHAKWRPRAHGLLDKAGRLRARHLLSEAAV